MFSSLLLIFLILIVTYFLGIFRGAPFVPTQADALERMIRSARIKPGEKLADLGSGDGRIVIAAGKAGAEAHGFEINPLLVWYSRRQIKKAGLSGRAFIHWKSFWRQDFSEFQIITIFGITSIMKDLEQKLKAELAPGSRVVSNIFRFPNWSSEKDGSVHVYRIEKSI
jgi:cyclopropane fatty-acyl-phospholipid synthase-like methyltransferase